MYIYIIQIKTTQIMKTSKFNKSEILTKAWALVRNNGYTLKNAMRTAWAYAKNKIADSEKAFNYKGDAERIFTSPTSRFMGDKLAALKATLVGKGLLSC